MDNDAFDLPGASSQAAAAPALSHLSVAYALLFYAAIAILVLGLAVQSFRLLRKNQGSLVAAIQMEGGIGARILRLFRAGTDVLLLRTTFFSDRWAWIFGAMFHFGLVLVLVRHLRYFIEPSWVGPLWKLVVLEQPFGFYAGFFLPIGAGAWWVRQMVVSRGRILAGWPDHAVMALLVVIPLVGYANALMHTDVVAVKAFMVGLVTLHWQPLPDDPLLLVHLWLVAVLMVLLPFSRVLLLLPFGRLLQLADIGTPPATHRASLLRVIAPVIAVVLLVPLAIAAQQIATHGFYPAPDFSSLIPDHRTDDATVMIRDHPRFLFNFRSQVVHHGETKAANNLERCVTCHAVKDASGQPVGFDNPKFFCRECHNRVAVTIDCFECHRSKPSPEGQSAVDSPPRFATVITPDSDRSAPK